MVPKPPPPAPRRPVASTPATSAGTSPVERGGRASARRRLTVTVAGALLAGIVALGCSSTTGATATTDETVAVGSGSATDTGSAPAPCPVDPIAVTVTVDQWGDLVRELGGACADVTTIITGASGDPHEYEPTPGDAAAFTGAKLVVLNGIHYDEWASKLLDGASAAPAVVDAGAVVGREDGGNPHVWYDPTAVDEVAAAVTERLQALAPTASDYFGAQATSWREDYAAVHDAVEALRARSSGASYVATESVFDDMAAAIGLEDVTPEGYRQAAANESEPAPGDLAAFERVLADGRADVLVVNTQTEGSLVDQLRSVADDAGVPVVEVSETMPDDVPSFVAWQQRQLDALTHALGAG